MYMNLITEPRSFTFNDSALSGYISNILCNFSKYSKKGKARCVDILIAVRSDLSGSIDYVNKFFRQFIDNFDIAADIRRFPCRSDVEVNQIIDFVVQQAIDALVEKLNEIGQILQPALRFEIEALRNGQVNLMCAIIMYGEKGEKS